MRKAPPRPAIRRESPQFCVTQNDFLKPTSAANSGYQCMMPLRRTPLQNSMPQTTSNTGCVMIFLNTWVMGRRSPVAETESSPVSKSL